MRLLPAVTLLLLPVAVVGQNATAYLDAVLGALTAANLTSLVSIFSGVANTTAGMALLGQLPMGNKTVFAPSNAAFANVSSAVAMNTTLLGEILSYHILNGSYAINSTTVAPAHTLAPTFFTGMGNTSVPVVLSRANASASSFFIAEAADNVTAMGPVSVENLQVYIIDKVLDLPPTIGPAVAAIDPPLANLLNMTTFIYRLTRAPAFTVFAPSGAAVQAAASTIATLNSTLVYRVINNHVINGSLVYSNDLAQRNYTSAGGEPFVITSNATGAYVTSGMTTAKIIQSDIILENGVAHVIDAVLANPMKNYSAAVAAYSSNVAAQATQTLSAPSMNSTMAGE